MRAVLSVALSSLEAYNACKATGAGSALACVSLLLDCHCLPLLSNSFRVDPDNNIAGVAYQFPTDKEYHPHLLAAANDQVRPGFFLHCTTAAPCVTRCWWHQNSLAATDAAGCCG